MSYYIEQVTGQTLIAYAHSELVSEPCKDRISNKLSIPPFSKNSCEGIRQTALQRFKPKSISEIFKSLTGEGKNSGEGRKLDTQA